MTLREFYSTIGGNYDEAVSRLRKETLVAKYVRMFLGDESYGELCRAVDAQDWQAAFAASHNLKGMSANLAFTALYEVSSCICENLRHGNPDDYVYDQLDRVKREYARVEHAIEELE